MRPNIFKLLLVFGLISFNGFGQKFNPDGSMVITKISKDNSYGTEPDSKTSIKVGTVANEYKYLASLQGPNGEEITYVRIASCCGFKCKSAPFKTGLLDKWSITYDGLDEPIIIYLNGYQFDNPMCPVGLGFK